MRTRSPNPHLIAILGLASAALVGGCSGESVTKSDVEEGPWSHGRPIAPEPQGHGDPARGRELLLNGNFMSCGIPAKLWDDATLGPSIRATLGGEGATIEGRQGKNAELPYWLNSFTTADGAEVMNRNCLSCHGGRFDGELVLGLGNAAADFTGGLAEGAPTSLPDTLLDGLGLTPAEKSNFQKMLRVGAVIGPATVMRTVGMNPAEQLTGILIGHHHQTTLAWSDEVITPQAPVLDDEGNPVPDPRLTSDPPPWWRAHKKNALFYNGMARGDHRGTMALATAVCVDTIEEAERVDALFVDMHAYVLTLRPPVYRRPVDRALASEGRAVFQDACAGCHGTYAEDPADDEHDTYPNLMIPLDVIGTDTAVADAPIDNPALLEWYNGSFYGEIARAEPSDPFPGYVPPPLDGVWATAPYLHNGSVPNVELLLDSTARPRYWKRVDLDDGNFDEEALGWPYEEVPYSQAEAPEAERSMVYDTTYFSQTNTGHTFGDHLTQAERRAVIEYLKTL